MSSENINLLTERPIVPLPEHEGDTSRAYWHQVEQAHDLLRHAAEGQHEHIVDLALPEVVGYIPESEWPKFEAVETPLSGEQVLLPGFRRVVENDLILLGVTDVYEDVNNAALLRNAILTEAVRIPVEQDGDKFSYVLWHMDASPFAYSQEGTLVIPPVRLSYIVSNKFPTLLYGGKLHIRTEKYGEERWEINQDGTVRERSDQTVIAQAPPYAIVRLGPLGLHSRPIVPENTHRVFERVSLYPK